MTTSDQWHVPLSDCDRVLGECFAELKAIGLSQNDIPLVVKLVENPNYDWLPGFEQYSWRSPPTYTSFAFFCFIFLFLRWPVVSVYTF